MPHCLTKKEPKWCWSQAIFDGLKCVMMEEPVLWLLDNTTLFELQTNAFNLAINKVLIQEGHPVAYESQKLSESNQHYTTQVKEITTVIHCLRM